MGAGIYSAADAQASSDGTSRSSATPRDAFSSTTASGARRDASRGQSPSTSGDVRTRGSPGAMLHDAVRRGGYNRGRGNSERL